MLRMIALTCCLTLAGCSVWATNPGSPVKLEGCQLWAPSVDLITAGGLASIAPTIAFQNSKMSEDDQSRMMTAGLFFATGFFMSALMGYAEYFDCLGYLPLYESCEQ